MYLPAKRRICALASSLPSAVTRLLYSLERYAWTSFNTEEKSRPCASASKNRPWVRSVLASRLCAAVVSPLSGDSSPEGSMSPVRICCASPATDLCISFVRFTASPRICLLSSVSAGTVSMPAPIAFSVLSGQPAGFLPRQPFNRLSRYASPDSGGAGSSAFAPPVFVYFVPVFSTSGFPCAAHPTV